MGGVTVDVSITLFSFCLLFFFFKIPLLSMLDKFLLDFLCTFLSPTMTPSMEILHFQFRLFMKDIIPDHFLLAALHVYACGSFGIEIRSLFTANKMASIIINIH